ncbi:MAG: ribosome maturation factor RimM, partial [Bacillota bacterium]
MKPESIAIGQVTSTHGLQGEVKVYPLTDFPERFDSLDDIVLETAMGQQVMHIEGIKYLKSMLILKFREISTVDEAEKLRGATLQVSPEQLVTLPDGHYYIFQIIGLTVVEENGEELGVVEDIRQTG